MVRVVSFTSAPNTIQFYNSYEPNMTIDDDAAFALDSLIIDNEYFDHTDFIVYSHALLLNGDSSSRVGSVLFVPVGKGDTVNTEVFAKYEDTSTTNNQILGSIASMILSAIPNSSLALGEAGLNSVNSTLTEEGGLVAARNNNQGFEDAGILGFLNVLFISEDGKTTRFAFDQITEGQQPIGDQTKYPHDRLAIENFVAPANGSIVVFVSNEHQTRTNIYFDDISVTISEHPVIQTDDYYPFGLSFNSFRRASSKLNKYNTFQDQEKITDLKLNWIQFKWRNHDPTTGRFFNIDPLAEDYFYNSPYAFSENKLLSYRELEGLEAVSSISQEDYAEKYKNVGNLPGALTSKKATKELKREKGPIFSRIAVKGAILDEKLKGQVADGLRGELQAKVGVAEINYDVEENDPVPSLTGASLSFKLVAEDLGISVNYNINLLVTDGDETVLAESNMVLNGPFPTEPEDENITVQYGYKNFTGEVDVNREAVKETQETTMEYIITSIRDYLGLDD